jgi:predicted RNA-binding Zn-ribbon protein involved in translation (DUF1610 family)
MSRRTRCPVCGEKIEKTIAREFRDKIILGLSGVVLVDSVVRYSCPACGFAATSIPRQGELGTAIAVARVKHRQEFAGAEVRFLRRRWASQLKPSWQRSASLLRPSRDRRATSSRLKRRARSSSASSSSLRSAIRRLASTATNGRWRRYGSRRYGEDGASRRACSSSRCASRGSEDRSGASLLPGWPDREARP